MTKAKNLLTKLRPFGYGAFFGSVLVVITWAARIFLPSLDFISYSIAPPIYLILLSNPLGNLMNAASEFVCPTPEMFKGTAYSDECQAFFTLSTIFILNAIFYGIIFQVGYSIYRRLKKPHA